MIKVLTTNIRYSKAADGPNSWPLRKELCAEVISRQDADVVCMQEMTVEQLDFLGSRLSAYDAVSTLDTPATGEPANTILFRRRAFRLRSSGAYWLSETPHISGSRSWQSDCIRLAVWAQLAPTNGEPELRVVNTHLDHVSQLARENQARMLSEDAAAYPGSFPQLLTGDMNCSSTNPALAGFLAAGWRDSYAEVHGTLEPGHTYHAFQGPAFAAGTKMGKIDWIFCRGAVRAAGAEVIRDGSGGLYPSDHYFVSATFRHE